MAELKKCPFCGGEAKITCESSYGGIETISCKKCHVDIRRLWCEGTPLESEVNVLAAWNNRVTEADIRAKAIEEFADFLHKKAKENNGLRLSSETKSWTHACIYDYVKEFKEQLKGE